MTRSPQFGLYYRLSIYRGYIWYGNTHSMTVTMIKLRSDLHSRTTSHTIGPAMGCLSWVIRKKKDRDISRAHCIWLCCCLGTTRSITAATENVTVIAVDAVGVVSGLVFWREFPTCCINLSPTTSPKKKATKLEMISLRAILSIKWLISTIIFFIDAYPLVRD